MSWKLATGVSFVEADGGAVLLDGQKGTFWQLNRTGALILKTLISHESTEAVITQLERSFNQERSEFEDDVKTLTEKVESLGLVEYEP